MVLRQRTTKVAANQDVEDKMMEEREPLVDANEPKRLDASPKKLGLFTLVGLGIVLAQVCCEVIKILSNYSLQYYTLGQYPIPQTAIVVICEIIKLLGTIIRSKCTLPSMSLSSFKSSLRFLLPSVLYAINNNIYYAGLTLVPPPIWMILCSSRTVVTASIYKFVLKRQLSAWQFIGVMLIVISIGVAKTPDLLQIFDSPAGLANANATEATTVAPQAVVNAVPMSAILLALVASCNSVGAAVYTEQLFKSGAVKGESFLEQQFWLYLYGALVASLVHLASNPFYLPTNLISDLLDLDLWTSLLLLVAVLFASLGGLIVASILKYLDNIVKEYTASVANIITALASSFLFPDKFKFTLYIVLSMASLLTGILLYETKKSTRETTAASSKVSNREEESK